MSQWYLFVLCWEWNHYTYFFLNTNGLTLLHLIKTHKSDWMDFWHGKKLTFSIFLTIKLRTVLNVKWLTAKIQCFGLTQLWEQFFSLILWYFSTLNGHSYNLILIPYWLFLFNFFELDLSCENFAFETKQVIY